jgi:hypothetical protein
VRVPVKTVTAGAIVGTAAVVAWLLVHAREDPPRSDRGPIAMPIEDAAHDAGDTRDASGAVLSDAPQ